MVNLGVTLGKGGQHTEARRLIEQALAGFERTLGVDHPSIQWARSELEVLAS